MPYIHIKRIIRTCYNFLNVSLGPSVPCTSFSAIFLLSSPFSDDSSMVIMCNVSGSIRGLRIFNITDIIKKDIFPIYAITFFGSARSCLRLLISSAFSLIFSPLATCVAVSWDGDAPGGCGNSCVLLTSHGTCASPLRSQWVHRGRGVGGWVKRMATCGGEYVARPSHPSAIATVDILLLFVSCRAGHCLMSFCTDSTSGFFPTIFGYMAVTRRSRNSTLYVQLRNYISIHLLDPTFVHLATNQWKHSVNSIFKTLYIVYNKDCDWSNKRNQLIY